MVHHYDADKVDISNIDINDDPNIIPGVDLRYDLTIPFKNRTEGMIATVILMNPSTANRNISDGTVNKLIEFFYTYSYEGIQVKVLHVVNVIPVYGSTPGEVASKLKKLHRANLIGSIQAENIEEISSVLADTNTGTNTDIVVFAWGKPKDGTIHNLYYYSQVYKIAELTFSIKKDDVYVFDIGNATAKLTMQGDPRHARGSATLSGLLKTNLNELLGLI